MKIIAGFIFIFFLGFSIVRAQDTLDASIKTTIDKGLSRADMNANDLWLPQDFYDDDDNRLPLVKSFFDNPLKAAAFTTYNGEQLCGPFLQNFESYFSRLFSALDLKTLTLYSYDNVIPSRKVNEFLNTDIDSVMGFVGAALTRQYIQPLIQVNNIIQKDFLVEKSNRLSYLEQYAGLFLNPGDEIATANVFELKAREDSDLVKADYFFRYAKGVRQSEMFSHGISSYNYLLKLANLAVKNLKTYQDSVRTILIDTKLGRIAIGGRGDNTYNGDFVMIIDVGGNDKYILPSLTKEQAAKKHVCYIVDLEGDDTYIGGDYSLGGAFFGINILIDLKGSDTYIGGNFSLGSGLFGVGILHDIDGSDTYSSKSNSEGAGAFGIGMLIDNAGNDSYKCQTQGQGFGFTRGWGALADFSGNDIYTSVSPYQDFLRYESHFVSFTQGAGLGYRPVASGGYGFLADGGGNDSYVSDIYGQGTGYWFALGGLYDKSGDDRYQSYQYAQGSGVHLAFGVLIDAGGEDVYVSHGVSQGCGHDVAFGLLADVKGNDMYFAESLSLGAGNANAISILADARGDDAYFARNPDNTFGYSDFRRSYGMIGLFADGSGLDSYGSTKSNNSMNLKSTLGIFADMDLFASAGQSAIAVKDAEKKPELFLADGIDSLFVQASAASEKHQYMVAPAREKIIAMGTDAIPFVASKLSTKSARERLALEYLLPKLYETDSLVYRTFLLDSLSSADQRTLFMVATALGKKKVKESLPRLYELLDNADWRVRSLAAQQAGEIGDQESVGYLVKKLSDRNPIVRARAAYSIGKIFPDNIISKLKSALEEECQVVRNNAIQGILTNKPFSGNLIIAGLKDSLSVRAKKLLARLIPDSYLDEGQIESFRSTVASMPDPVRETAYRAIIASSSDFWKEDLKNYAAKENNPALVSLVKSSPTGQTFAPVKDLKEKPDSKKDKKDKKDKDKKEKKDKKNKKHR